MGAGLFYGAAATETPVLTGKQAFVIGGGNSAGQAALYLIAGRPASVLAVPQPRSALARFNGHPAVDPRPGVGAELVETCLALPVKARAGVPPEQADPAGTAPAP
jgi:thioredoxin reductase (NADPH)